MGTNNIKLTQEEAEQRFLDYGYFLKDTYVNNRKNVTYYDKEGYKYFAPMGRLQFSKSMPVHNGNIYTLENIRLYLKKEGIDDQIELCEDNKYISNYAKLDFKCLRCGDTFKMNWAQCSSNPKHLNGYYGCPKCVRKLSSESQKKTMEEVVEYFKSKGLTVTDSEYVKNSHCINFIDELGYKGNISLANLQKDRKYNLFSYAFNRDNFIHNLNNFISINNINSEAIEITGNDGHGHTVVKFKCECGEYFDTVSSRFINGLKTKCDRCVKAVSKIEIMTMEYLDKNNIEYIREHYFEGCRNDSNNRPLFFDFYIQSENLCIECDGRQHYEVVKFGGISEEEATEQFIKTQRYDNIKNKYCEKNNINLIRISHKDFENGKYLEILEKILPINK